MTLDDLRRSEAFSTRIYSFSAAAGDPLKAMVKAAQLILEEELPGVQVTSQASPSVSKRRDVSSHTKKNVEPQTMGI